MDGARGFWAPLRPGVCDNCFLSADAGDENIGTALSDSKPVDYLRHIIAKIAPGVRWSVLGLILQIRAEAAGPDRLDRCHLDSPLAMNRSMMD